MSDISLAQQQPTRHWPTRGMAPILGLVLLAILSPLLIQHLPERSAYYEIQIEWFLALNQILSCWPAAVWSNITELGDAAVLLLLLSPILLWRPDAWVAMIASAPMAALLSVSLKYLAGIPRPAAVLDSALFTVVGDTMTGHNSMPSGHSITIFAGVIALLASLSPSYSGWRHNLLLIVGITAATAVSVSRVAIGAHWPLDVFCGAVAGWLAALSGLRLTELLIHQPTPDRIRYSTLSVVVLLVVAAAILSIHALEQPINRPIFGLAVLFALITALLLLRRHQKYQSELR